MDAHRGHRDDGRQASRRSSNPWQSLSHRDFYIEKEIARTNAGSVFKAKHHRTGLLVVLKSRRSAEIGKDGNIMHEVEILQSLDHPNIIRCYGSFWHKEIGTFYMVLEFCERGDLSQLIEEQRRRKELLTEREVWRIFIPVMKAVEYLHDKGIIHRDIKALNIFRTANDEIKVGDLGVGRVLGPETVMVETMYGTPLYLSPELCDNRPYNHKTDMWSLGILLYELCALHTPFHGRSLLELSKAICKDEIKPVPSQFSVLISRSIASLLERDQAKRPSAKRFLDWLYAAKEKIAAARHRQHHEDQVEQSLEEEVKAEREQTTLQAQTQDKQQRESLASKKEDTEVRQISQRVKDVEISKPGDNESNIGQQDSKTSTSVTDSDGRANQTKPITRQQRSNSDIPPAIPRLSSSPAGLPSSDQLTSRSSSSTSSARIALLSARRQTHISKQQSSNHVETIRFVDAGRDRGLNSRDGPRVPYSVTEVEQERGSQAGTDRTRSSSGRRSEFALNSRGSDWFESSSDLASQTRSSQESFLDKLGEHQVTPRRRGGRPQSASQAQSIFGIPKEEENIVSRWARVGKDELRNEKQHAKAIRSHPPRPPTAPWPSWQ